MKKAVKTVCKKYKLPIDTFIALVKSTILTYQKYLYLNYWDSQNNKGDNPLFIIEIFIQNYIKHPVRIKNLIDFSIK